MYTVRLEHRDDDKHKPGEPGQQPDGSYITPEGERLTTEEDKATYLRTAQDWIVTPLLKNTPGLAGVDSIGGYAKQLLVVPDVRSEEHTSELQSLLRTSYAVYCLRKITQLTATKT